MITQLTWYKFAENWPEDDSEVLIHHDGETYFGYFEDGEFIDYANRFAQPITYWAYLEVPK